MTVALFGCAARASAGWAPSVAMPGSRLCFQSGRGFGYIVYPPREDDLPTYNEGYIFDGDGELIPAWVVEAPWLRRLRPSDEDVSVVLETADGTTEIQGMSVVSNFMVMGGVGDHPDFPVLQQASCATRGTGRRPTG